MTKDQIKVVADEILSVTLGQAGFDEAHVAEYVEVDGEPTIVVTARFKRGSGAADGKAAAAALTALRSKLQDEGEERFPFMRYDFPDDEDTSITVDDLDS